MVPVGTIVLPPLEGAKENALPLATEVVCAVMAGVGFTVTVTVNTEPTQFPDAPDVGVTV